MLDEGIIIGVVTGAGAAWRAYKGYQGQIKKGNGYKDFNWRKFLISVLPAFGIGFAAGAVYSPLPDLLSAGGIMLLFMMFSGGAGVGSLQGKLPFKKKK